LKILIDQQLPPLLADWLRSGGYDATHVREIDLKDSPDHEIGREAKRRRAVVVRRDSDFANFARQDRDGRLVWLRVGNCANPDLIALFEATWGDVAARLEQGERIVEVRP